MEICEIVVAVYGDSQSNLSPGDSELNGEGCRFENI
jgi:hypothetical protein